MKGVWTSSTVAGKKVDVYDPAGHVRPRFALLYLHGSGLETLVGNTVWTTLFDELHLACACPHGQRCWWTDRVCPAFDPRLTNEQHLLKNVVPFMHQRWQLGPRSVGVTGISMGGQGALRLAFKHPQRFAVVAAVAPALDFHDRYGEGTPLDAMYDSKEQCRQDTAILHIHPSEHPPHVYFAIDPEDADWVRGNDRLHEKLNALGVEHTIDFTTSAGGHTWAYFDRMAEPAIRFIHEGLQMESRRLL